MDGGQRELRLFGNMAVIGHQPPDAAGAEPRAQPVNQFGEPATGSLRPVKRSLGCSQRFRQRDMQHKPVIAKARIKRVSERGDPFIK